MALIITFPEDGGDRFFWNVYEHLQYNVELQSSMQQSTFASWKPQIFVYGAFFLLCMYTFPRNVCLWNG
jgi:hypothetical protein